MLYLVCHVSEKIISITQFSIVQPAYLSKPRTKLTQSLTSSGEGVYVLEAELVHS